MAVVMKGMEVAKSMKNELIFRVEKLKESGIIPSLAILRVGEKEEDLSYERGAKKRLEGLGVVCETAVLPEDVTQEDFEKKFDELNVSNKVHGILVFQPLPKHLNIEPVKERIHPRKDVDGMSPVNMGRVFANDKKGVAPCTPAGVIEMLKHFEIPIEGKEVVIVGRSSVVGKPLSILFLQENATVTICHTRTKNLEDTCKGAEILVAAAGVPKMIKASMVSEGCVVVDVGINVDEEGKLCGDVDYEQVEPLASYISPTPGGTGSVTSSVLAKHVIESAES
ncbi:methylenetetrahydrofolate dehydrogenase (NADP+)/methenyltetrahydrofolate cyclohydrolase [Aequitasia blattaphilus]|uniref:Bifunctional protein FolD n=1 Tax=Aequitasia blattaphilus TaxID=2949332 RepID=A0ABT1E8J1_9FIRM|nr:tetrahydrofolate dehydrogenase/cyclohydrolase catalytic domain-containing protein [Aequitasia blattaphilus]MCP1101196.1 bifunctional 5,10-methylene-tetrahydrofolate dehydrogenase/5,10-methylene-tetrahydrofolate cyclohydrolase [Aequitasia blattaphilus]MCR8613836.1 bifunctional 5,10-methylene-tetrahydrofolate dehydrogenase/5,10-methylene-tetrahydrofolate cyclohydrolase [Aequitasia blattaphilus]